MFSNVCPTACVRPDDLAVEVAELRLRLAQREAEVVRLRIRAQAAEAKVERLKLAVLDALSQG